jgi:hypothetical protein
MRFHSETRASAHEGTHATQTDPQREKRGRDTERLMFRTKVSYARTHAPHAHLQVSHGTSEHTPAAHTQKLAGIHEKRRRGGERCRSRSRASVLAMPRTHNSTGDGSKFTKLSTDPWIISIMHHRQRSKSELLMRHTQICLQNHRNTWTRRVEGDMKCSAHPLRSKQGRRRLEDWHRRVLLLHRSVVLHASARLSLHSLHEFFLGGRLDCYGESVREQIAL